MLQLVGLLFLLEDELPEDELPDELEVEDKWIISTLNSVAKEAADNLDKFELGIAVAKIYDFIWDYYCDWYIELAKARLQSEGKSAQNARQVLVWVLEKALRLLHPFMPFITEEIWQTLPHDGQTIMLKKFPEYDEALNFTEAALEMTRITDAIKAIRNRRAEMNVPPSRKAKVYVASQFADTFANGAKFIKKLAYAGEVEVGEAFDIDGAVTVVTADAKIYIPMEELVDKEAELKRLNKELEATLKLLKQDEGKLNNTGFMSKAPEKVIEKIRMQAAKEQEKIAMINAAIEALK